MRDRPSHFGHIEPEAAREYLLTLAASLQELASPDFRGDVAGVAAKSVRTLVRIAQQIVPLDAKRLTAMAAPPRLVGEGAVLDALEDERTALLGLVRTLKDRPAFDAPAFEAYLRRHPMFTPQTCVRTARELTGGRAKRTVLIELERQGDAPAQMIFRQDLPSVYPRSSVSFEFPLIAALHRDGIKVPKPLLLEAAGPLGGAFILVDKLAGRSVGDLLSPPRSAPLALQLAVQIGKLHALPTEPYARLPELRAKIHAVPQLQELLAWYRDLYARYDAPSETISGVFDWLQDHVSDVEGPLVVLHADVGFHNILVEDAVLQGIVDWEEAHLGNPAEDLGYCRSDVETMIEWPRFLRAYREAGGPPCSDVALDFYSLLGELKVYCSAVMTRPSVASGKIRDLGIAECIVDWTPMLRHRLSRRLRSIGAA